MPILSETKEQCIATLIYRGEHKMMEKENVVF